MTSRITPSVQTGLASNKLDVLVGVRKAAATALAGHALCSFADSTTMACSMHVVPYSIVNSNFVHLITAVDAFATQVESQALAIVRTAMSHTVKVEFQRCTSASQPIETEPGGMCVLQILLSTPYIASGKSADACYYIKQLTLPVTSATKCSCTWVEMASVKQLIWDNLCFETQKHDAAFFMPSTPPKKWLYSALPASDTDSNGLYTSTKTSSTYNVCMPVLESTGTGYMESTPTHVTTATPEPPGGFIIVKDVKRKRTERHFASYLQKSKKQTLMRRNVLRTMLATKLKAFDAVLFSIVQCTEIHTTKAMCNAMALHLWHHTWFCMFGSANSVMCKQTSPALLKGAGTFIYEMQQLFDSNVTTSNLPLTRIDLQFNTPPFHVPILIHVVHTFCTHFGTYVYGNASTTKKEQYECYKTERAYKEDILLYNAMENKVKSVATCPNIKPICNRKLLLTRVRRACTQTTQYAQDFTLELSHWDYLNLAIPGNISAYQKCTVDLLQTLAQLQDGERMNCITTALSNASIPAQMYSKLFWKTFAQCQTVRTGHQIAMTATYSLEPLTRTDVLVSESVQQGIYVYWKTNDIDDLFQAPFDVNRDPAYTHTLHDNNAHCSIATLSRYTCNDLESVVNTMIDANVSGFDVEPPNTWSVYFSTTKPNRNTLLNPLTATTLPAGVNSTEQLFNISCAFDGTIETPAYAYHKSDNTKVKLSDSTLTLDQACLKHLTQ